MMGVQPNVSKLRSSSLCALRCAHRRLQRMRTSTPRYLREQMDTYEYELRHLILRGKLPSNYGTFTVGFSLCKMQTVHPVLVMMMSSANRRRTMGA